MKTGAQIRADRRLAWAIGWIQIEKLFSMGEKRISFNGQIMNRQEWKAYKLATIHKSLYNKDLKAQGLDHKEHNRRNRVSYAAREKQNLESIDWQFMGVTHKYRNMESPFFYTRRWYKKGGINPASYEQRLALRKEIEKADLREEMLRDNARVKRLHLQNERKIEQYRESLLDSA